MSNRPVIYHVRHGQTDWNVQSRLQGRRDIPLNAHGRQQAMRSGEILRDLLARHGRTATDCDYIASPLGRARETMELVRSRLELAPQPYRIETALTEISFGDWEGMTFEELETREPGAFAAREADKWWFLPPGGENYAEVAHRVWDWYGSLQNDTIVAAHGGTARALMALLDIMEPVAAAHEPIDQGAVYVFDGLSVVRHV